ncbi:MAG: branched-chain amino acid ABC transporter permease [Calditrichaeota bacterium]|nr:branched-chain amino acid ABC transporter permease [Calditrichota bacterium]
MAHAAFYGVGAYTAALMALKLGTPLLLNIVCAVAFSSLLGIPVGLPSLRIRDDYFVIATFAFQVIAFSVLNNWVSFTRGPMGLPGIPQPVLGLFDFSTSWTVLGKNLRSGFEEIGNDITLLTTPLRRGYEAQKQDQGRYISKVGIQAGSGGLRHQARRGQEVFCR